MSTATVPALPLPPRVVADSNVLLAALYGGVRAGAVLKLARQGTITLCASPYILDEVARILAEKFDWALVGRNRK